MPYILRVDDIGRGPQDAPESGTDSDLSYFARWREAFGGHGLPVEYAAVPEWIGDAGLKWLSENLSAQERIALHGWDHRKGQRVTAEQMIEGKKKLESSVERVRSYVPPFNNYTTDTLDDWIKAGGEFFLGGFHGSHHVLGESPVTYRRSIHLPAARRLYGHIKEVLLEVEKDLKLGRPRELRVITLHVTWDRHNFDALRKLREIVAEHLVPTEKATEFIQ